MRLGVLVPSFELDAARAFEVAREVERAGLDGVFAYDHLWPMGSPERPSLAPFALLSAIARRHEHLIVAPLVARVGLVGTAHLVEEFLTLEALAPGRVIATLGTGDRLSALENEAYGLRTLGAAHRRALVEETAVTLSGTMPVWIGAGARATNDLARHLGVELNLWNADPSRVAEFAQDGLVNWAGPVPEDLVVLLDALEVAGASWAVFTPNVEVDALREWREQRQLSKFP